MYFGIIVLELLLMAEFMRRIKQFTALNVIFLYVLVSQTVFHFAEYLGFTQFAGADSRQTFLYDNDLGIQLYAAIFSLIYISSIGISIDRRYDLAGSLKTLLASNIGGLQWVAPALYFFAVIHLLSLDKSILWYNNTYLLLNSPLAMTDALGAGLLTSLFQIFAASSIFLFSITLFQGRLPTALCLLPLALWGLLFNVACCSRYSAILAFLSGMIAIISLNGIKRSIFAFFWFSLGLFLLVVVLNGRSAAAFGVGAVPDILLGGLNLEFSKVVYAVANIFQGIFVSTDGITINAEHPASYKLLSFSPLPSLLDGFEEIRRSQEIRVARYVPMSAISEVILFGYPYVILASSVLILLLRKYLRFVQAGRANLSMILAGWIILIFIQANAYPLRNVFRQALLALFVMLVVGAVSRSRPPQNRPLPLPAHSTS